MDSGLFNENSRKINDHDVDETIYTKTNPPDSSNLNGYKFFYDLSSIGITKGSETIEDIAIKLPAYSILVLSVDKDFNQGIYPVAVEGAKNGILRVTKSKHAFAIFEYFFRIGSVSYIEEAPLSWFGFYSNPASSQSLRWSGWFETSHNVGYLPLTGSKPMAGDLVIEKHVASVTLKQGEETGTAGVVIRHDPGNGLEMRIADDTSLQKNTRFLQLRSIASGTTLTDALTLVELTEGQSGGVSHLIYGSHNTDKLKSKLMALQFATKNDISNFATKTEVSNAITTAIGNAIAASY